MKLKPIKTINGFTIIEMLVSVAIFAILATAMLGIFQILTTNVKLDRQKTVLAGLANNYLEIVRNMSYSQVGTLSGNPHGGLPDFNNSITQKIGDINFKIYYEVTYIDDPADGTILAGTDPYPDDYKQVKMDILNTSTGLVTSFVTNVVPKGLEGTINAGAFLFKVFDSAGQPVSGATIHITYPTTSPTIILDRQTDSTGQWVEVGLPAGVNNYHVVVTKAGYSSDATYQITGQNPNPTKPDPTIVNGQVTQVSFSIDLLSTLNLKTLNNICQPVGSINVNVSGAKLVGSNPNVLKFNQNYTSVIGLINLPNSEWDTYTPTLLTGQGVIVYGTSPIQSIDVLPGTSQTFTMILGNNSTANSLLVIVKDSATGTALENAFVTLSTTGYSQTFVTGGSVWLQNDWSGGSGQSQYSTSTPNQYFQDNGNIDTSGAGSVKLLKVSGSYVAATGTLESATFDTGTAATNYTTLSWQPASQSASTTAVFQIAANNDNSTWNYVGPDGTANTYFTTPGTDMGGVIDNNRYMRYKLFLSTANQAKTPVVTSVSSNFVTGCFTPGQVIFAGLNSGSYTASVSLSGYSTQTVNNININGNQTLTVLMSP